MSWTIPTAQMNPTMMTAATFNQHKAGMRVFVGDMEISHNVRAVDIEARPNSLTVLRLELFGRFEVKDGELHIDPDVVRPEGAALRAAIQAAQLHCPSCEGHLMPIPK